MKRQSAVIPALFFSAALFSCGGEKETSEEKAPSEDSVKTQVCTYSYDHSTTIVQWTAYKFTEKAAVMGKFDTVAVAGTKTSEDAMQVISGATFDIKTSGTQTNDAEKNANIISAFFGKMMNTASLTGTVKSVEKDKAVISIKMNEAENDVEGTVTMDGNKLIFKADINLDKWNGQEAIKSLNKKCEKNHTGKDGKLLVWPDVSLYVETTLKKECK